MEKTVGYTRAATDEQERQVAALRAAGCAPVFIDTGRSCKGLRRALAAVEPGDTFMVHRVDQLALPRRRLYALIDRLLAQGCLFTSLTDPEVAARLDHEVNYAPEPTPQSSLVRYVLFKLGKRLVRTATLP